MAGVAEKLPHSVAPEAWEARAGTYEVVRRTANGSYRWPRDVALSVDGRSGILLLSYTFAGARASFPLVARGDHEALVAGVGTGLGEQVCAREEGEEVLLEWAGLLLRRAR